MSVWQVKNLVVMLSYLLVSFFKVLGVCGLRTLYEISMAFISNDQPIIQISIVYSPLHRAYKGNVSMA